MRQWIAYINTVDQMLNAEFVSLVSNNNDSDAYRSLSAIVGHARTFCADERFLIDHVKNLALYADARRCNTSQDFCSVFEDENFDVLTNFTDEIQQNKDSFNDSDKYNEYGTFEKWINSVDDDSQLHVTIARLRQMINTSYIAEKVSCASEFGKFLAGVLDWLDAMSLLNESLPLQPIDQTGAIVQLNESIAWLKASTEAYTIGGITLVRTNTVF